MNSRNIDKVEAMDYKTSRAICDAVGERLERDLHAEHSSLSPHLRRLMVELLRRDSADRL
jgi:hypothetical protein